MNPLQARALWILLAMCATALLTRWIEPSIRLADQGTKINLESMIPREIGNWRIDDAASAASSACTAPAPWRVPRPPMWWWSASAASVPGRWRRWRARASAG
jgi:hypothetical protein